MGKKWGGKRGIINEIGRGGGGGGEKRRPQLHRQSE